jgi:hypothetical protein
MKKSVWLFMIIACSFALSSTCAVAAASWQEDFDRLCAYTDQTEEMAVDKLKGLVEACDKLLGVIEKSDSPQKKVYIFRLRKCRNFFQYMAELKEQDGGT